MTDDEPQSLSLGGALRRWCSAMAVAVVLTASMWLVSLISKEWTATAVVGMAFPMAFINRPDRHWLRASLTAHAVALPLTVVGVGVAEWLLPDLWHVAVGFGFGYFFGALAYARVTQRPMSVVADGRSERA